MNRSNDRPPPNFIPWGGHGHVGTGRVNIGEILVRSNGALRIDLHAGFPESRKVGVIEFEVPMAMRVVDQGMLGEYWGKVAVSSGAIYVADQSAFLDWAIPHNVDDPGARARHYGIFTDDTCIEVLSYLEPSVFPAQQDGISSSCRELE